MAPIKKIGSSEISHASSSESYEEPERGYAKIDSKLMPDWDRQVVRGSKSPHPLIGQFIVGGLLFLVTAGVLLLVLIDPAKEQQAETLGGDSSDSELTQEATELNSSHPFEALNEEPDKTASIYNRPEFLEKAETLVKKFLEAKSVEEMLPLIRNADTVEAKLRAYYPDGVIENPEMMRFDSSNALSHRDGLVSIAIVTKGYEKKQVGLVEVDGELKVDWESWVGWSEMPWSELVKQKPLEPTLVRVILKNVDYYNFDFSDERKWRSYSLISPDESHVLYGYVQRNSALDKAIRPNESKAVVYQTLKIHFTESKDTRKQVIIDEVVADGWVEP